MRDANELKTVSWGAKNFDKLPRDISPEFSMMIVECTTDPKKTKRGVFPYSAN